MGWCRQHGPYIHYCKRCLPVSVRALLTRFGDLKASPWVLSQDAFGVCGMASALYLLLKKPDKAKADALFHAAFGEVIAPNAKVKAQFTVNGTDYEIPFSYIGRRYFNQMESLKRKGEFADADRETTFKEHFVDFGMCRALGYLFKVVHPTKYHAEKAAIWAHVPGGDVPRTRHNARMQGNLPLRTNALGHIIQDLLALKVTCIAYNWLPPFGYENPGKRQEKMGDDLPGNVTYKDFHTVDEFFAIFNRRRAKLDATFSVAGIKALTLVTDPILGARFGDAQLGLEGQYIRPPRPIAGPAIPPGGPTPLQRQQTVTQTDREVGDPYDHWVVLESASRQNNPNRVHVRLWTWAERFELRLTDDAFLHAFHDVIFGEV